MIDATAEAAPARPVTPLWRRLVFSLTLWGVLLLATAVGLALGGSDLDIWHFILIIVGGWCLGAAFVNLTVRMPRDGVVLHVAGAVVIAAIMVFLTEYGRRLVPIVGEQLATVAFVVQLAAVPAAAWIWIGLLSRITDAILRRDRRRGGERVTPEWERDERGDGSFVRFPGIEVRMRDVTLAIIGIVLAAGAVGVALMIWFDGVVMRLGPRMSIVLVGLVLGLPAYFALTAVLRRHTAACTLAFGNDEVRIKVDEASFVIRHRDLEYLRWRQKSDYARVEVRGGGVDLSLFTGLAKPPPGRTAELPPIPRRVFRRLELAGFAMEESRRGEVITFHRA
ncbi:hypothetical protein [Streptomyces sp. AC495_CC817]|uniref:hypothetical protein n=1 Tax=Streptomyces sp. AC495_CC817 TaxID=2823900 RepID=UPI001C258EA4|nr:hypothetical protein [Streptomyces sp. AC495_CC817]